MAGEDSAKGYRTESSGSEAPGLSPDTQSSDEQLLDSLSPGFPQREDRPTEQEPPAALLGDSSRQHETGSSWGNRVGPQKLNPRHEVLAWMMASGAAPHLAAQELGYSSSRMSVLLGNTKIKARIQQIRDEKWGDNLKSRFSRLVPQAMDVVEGIVSGELSAKVETRFSAAQWAVEKVSGKPRQEVQHDGDGTLRQVLQLLDHMKTKQEAGSEATPVPSADLKDVTPVSSDPIDAWVDAHVPSLPGGSGK